MRSKNKSSLNIQSLKIDQLPIKRILLLVILSYLLMAFGLFFLTVYRMLVIPYAFNLVCSDVGLALLELCANEVIRIALYGPEWSAVKFSFYVVVLTPLFYLLLTRQKGSTTSSLLILAFTLSIAVITTLDGTWAEPLAVLISSLLVGCFIKKNRTSQAS
ncbi:MAG: hypothetical protein ACI80S_001343 [Pseudohongiellaceae bacterium]|jgi:hypothetical protein